MTHEDWMAQYRRLTKGFGRKNDIGQMDAYFDILSEFGIVRVEFAVTKALKESKFFPKVADLIEFVHAYRADHSAPAAICDVCHGDKFTYSTCLGWTFGPDTHPVDPRQVCRRDFPHTKHEDAHFCPQCHPAARRSA